MTQTSHHTARMFGALCCLTVTLLGCVSADNPEPTAARSTSVVSSGSLADAARGVRSISLHPSARVVRPIEGRSVESLRLAIEDAILAAITARGYTAAPPGQGDLVLAYAIGVNGELDDAELSRIFGIAPGLNTTRNSQDTRGAIVLVAMNPRSSLVQWRGAASSNADPAATTQQRNDNISRAIERILAGLPPRSS